MAGLIAVGIGAASGRTQDGTPAAVFRSSVDLVTVTAVVRDARGRVVRTLSPRDIEVFDNGVRRPILQLKSESWAPTSVALVIDGSGSMVLGGATAAARTIARRLLGSLRTGRDQAALFTFDTRLLALQDFTPDLMTVERRLDDVEAWGSTSLYDAVAGSAGWVARRPLHRGAVVVMTDGADTASRYSAAEVSAIASRIDVPVYVFAVTAPSEPRAALRAGELERLATQTGGAYFVAADPRETVTAIDQLLEELRYQHVIAFESARTTGWRAIDVRTRKPGLRIRSRTAYEAAASLPSVVADQSPSGRR